MNMEEIRQVAWLADDYLKGEIRGVVLKFHGMGYTQMKTEPDTFEYEWAKSGWLVIFPYYGPWSWMNRETRDYIDELVAAIYENFHLADNLPLVCVGDSLGGLASLLYARYSKKQPVACIAIWPVTDAKYSFGERPDVPRTVFDAFRGYKDDMETVFIEHSPLYQVKDMPDIPYLIIHGAKDIQVNKEMHSDRFVKKMKENDKNVKYIEVQDMGHGGPLPLDVMIEIVDFVNSAGI